jgi:hypothetical protein
VTERAAAGIASYTATAKSLALAASTSPHTLTVVRRDAPRPRVLPTAATRDAIGGRHAGA